MAKGGLVTPTKDEGEIHFNADVQRGKILVSVRAPLSIDKRTVEMDIIDLIDITAQVTIEWVALGRAVKERFEQQRKEAPQPA